MDILDDVILLIRSTRPVSARIDAKTNIYTDLGFDSLAYMELLARVENAFGFEFSITEMEPCLVAGALADMIKEKLEHDQKRAVQQ
ncbi:MAG: acyl carrier protein [Oscillospiraceae bacterium]|jgi:acyl carrier protein|nr:acyl carrier protein [Oscillospiraceae bacterium]